MSYKSTKNLLQNISIKLLFKIEWKEKPFISFSLPLPLLPLLLPFFSSLTIFKINRFSKGKSCFFKGNI